MPFRYQGQYYDEETGLSYNRFRYYDDNTGQYISQDPIGLAGGNPTLYGYVKDVNSWIDLFGLHDILADDDIVVRGGECKATNFTTGAEKVIKVKDGDDILDGISTQAKPGGTLDELSYPFNNGKVGVATVGEIEAAGGKITLDGELNSVDGTKLYNHATVDGLTAEQSEKLFKTQENPTPKEVRKARSHH